MKTAVEWLADQLKKQGFLYDLDIEAAKKKEKKQILKAWYDSDMIITGEEGEQYYNQTYNQNK